MLDQQDELNSVDKNATYDEIVAFIPALRAFARSLAYNAADADDLVQDTLMKAIGAAHRYKRGTNLRAWLFTIMRNTFYTSARRSARERTGDADCVSGELVELPTQEWTVRGQELMEAVHRLPPQFREMLILVVMLGESYEDSARICGCAIGTVKSRVARARRMVMEDLNETCV
jgi:RNA polymerase sigma-70 factor (ECF subfamily)